MQGTLAYQDHLFINFRDFDFERHAYRWIDIKRFGLSRPDVDGTHLLAELIGHEQYRDDYAGGGAEPDGIRHGSYWLRNISPAAFTRIDKAGANAILRGWAEQFGPLPAALSARLENEVHPLLAEAIERYRLEDLDREAFHDWGGVHIDFHELVLIDRVAGTLALLVAADD
ncbi:hypothetical protein GCM10010156_68660 [Planobispora rosea]|uniref:Uncharacterized protein n=1 Tax=Planobispora rosea TaxID=35762 RepID=A0A8J3S8T0_PLARO|nr:hypothetical protein [Planobispora rosea]GGT00797.1 hypothetical protein GCM10010156_68660 [Planobispora rosea]GIH88152.1 hypothetical protein Pro02_65600 [Planobispora rosea]